MELFIRKNSKSKLQSRVIALSENSVVDEGLHYFIKKNWKKLLKDKIANFKFILPTQQTYYRFTVKKEKETKSSVTFILKASGLMIQLVTKATRVTYDKKKRIINYQGLTNIRKNKEPVFVNMFFLY